ncbi:MAG: diguanylate cyclase [Gemmatimonadetes bacterium]|nr:diguanylate cyclase [Gemmatimonadota bacterium]
MPISTSYDVRLVALSVLIASLASYVALDVAGRTTAAHPRARLAWLAGGSCVMGVGIWSMHFIGMLAFGLRTGTHQLPIGYHGSELIGSVVVAIAASALALGVASRPRLKTANLLGAGVLMGGAIAGMHYLGMAAMRMPADLSYSSPLVITSIGIAVAASIVALTLARRLGETRSVRERWAKRVAAGVMGLAIAGMHYTAMAAARFMPPTVDMPMGTDAVLATSGLAIAVTIAAIVLLTVGLLGAALDRQHGRHLAERVEAGEARYRSLTESATDAIVSANVDGKIVFWNAAAQDTFDYTAAEVLGQPLCMLTPTDLVSRSLDSLRPRAADDRSRRGMGSVELEGVRRDHTVFPMEVSVSEWTDGSERLFTAIIRDVSRRKLTEAALRESERRFRDVVEQSPEAILLHAGGRVLYGNPAAANLIGIPAASTLVGRTLAGLMHSASVDHVGTSEASAAERSGVAQCRMPHSDGRMLDVETRSVSTSFNGQPAVQTHLRDVTEQQRLETQLAHQAFHDALTDLANRALFRDRVGHALARSARGRARPAVLFLDLDNFKSVNDGLGHSAGDELLRLIAQRLDALMRPSDTCARLGGDEFAILIEEPSAGDVASMAAHMAARVIEAFTRPCVVGGIEIVVTVSVGIAVATEQETAEDLLRNADVAMYRAKSRGKGRYEVFEPAMHELVRKRLELEAELRRAVELCESRDSVESRESGSRGEPPFILHFQPIASLRTGEIHGFEALVRWQHPQRGVVSPLDFIPIAEETGLIIPLGRWIMREACARAAAWQLAGLAGVETPDVGVTVNLSARQLLQPELPQDVAHALATTGLCPEHLTIEVTESMLVDDSETTLDRLRALKALGVRLAIDDFGTGYSSLGYLERFPVDLLKIDRSFVHRVGHGDSESPLARAILGLGKELGMQVVAEGIETEAQWNRLQELGCELGQGYYIAPPKPVSELHGANRNGRRSVR